MWANTHTSARARTFDDDIILSSFVCQTLVRITICTPTHTIFRCRWWGFNVIVSMRWVYAAKVCLAWMKPLCHKSTGMAVFDVCVCECGSHMWIVCRSKWNFDWKLVIDQETTYILGTLHSFDFIPPPPHYHRDSEKVANTNFKHYRFFANG